MGVPKHTLLLPFEKTKLEGVFLLRTFVFAKNSIQILYTITCNTTLHFKITNAIMYVQVGNLQHPHHHSAHNANYVIIHPWKLFP